MSMLRLPSDDAKPFRYALGGSDLLEPTVVRIYAWNATHGGGSARAADEYRIQLTGSMPEAVTGEVLVIVGWSQAHEVFVGWDPRIHDHRDSVSPSLQVREEIMIRASNHGIAAGVRSSGDVVVSFRPELLAAYCLSVQDLHDNPGLDTINWLNSIGSESEQVGPDRPLVERRLRTAYRAWDFSARVRQAYQYRCAICGLGLGLVEGAHIVPVAWPGSTDETMNGLALCRNHHAAYDRGLISVSPEYQVEVSLAHRNRRDRSDADQSWLTHLDGESLQVVPLHPTEKPNPDYLALGRSARRWAVDEI